MLNRCHSSFCLGVALTIGSTLLMQSESTAERVPERHLRHLVLYKFKDGLPEAEVEKVINAFQGLQEKIDDIVALEHGPNVSQEGKSDGFTYGFQVTFRDETGLSRYLRHPAHDAYVQVVKDRREKVLVFDYWARAER